MGRFGGEWSLGNLLNIVEETLGSVGVPRLVLEPWLGFSAMQLVLTSAEQLGPEPSLGSPGASSLI